MYRFREISLKNNQHEKAVLVMDFSDPQMAIVTEFFNESNLFLKEVLTKITALQTNELTELTLSGNRCHLTMNQENTKLTDLYEGLFEDTTFYPDYELKTNLLEQFIHAYLSRQAEINNKS